MEADPFQEVLKAIAGASEPIVCIIGMLGIAFSFVYFFRTFVEQMRGKRERTRQRRRKPSEGANTGNEE